MTQSLVFSGPDGDYEVMAENFHHLTEDDVLCVRRNGATSHWGIETAENSDAGTVILSGMTRDGSDLWFVLTVGPEPKIEYWGDRVLVRVDTRARSSQ
jgi:hypothetical protein